MDVWLVLIHRPLLDSSEQTEGNIYPTSFSYKVAADSMEMDEWYRQQLQYQVLAERYNYLVSQNYSVWSNWNAPNKAVKDFRREYPMPAPPTPPIWLAETSGRCERGTEVGGIGDLIRPEWKIVRCVQLIVPGEGYPSVYCYDPSVSR